MPFNSTVNIVSFDIPWPANYGGVIDVYYKIKALHDAGVKIILHCYEYGRDRTEQLNKICEKVYYYKRSIYKNPFYGNLPYIINSRNTKELIENLLTNDYPIVFEGLHTCYYLNDNRLKNRIKIVRTHNIEHEYYKNLEWVEGNYFKKYFFRTESEKLKEFESQLKHANWIASISPSDAEYYQKISKHVIHLPPFHENENVSSLSNRGDCILYHGNLAVGENDEAAKFLVRKVFSAISYPVIIAGNHPSKQLKSLIKPHKHIQLISDYNTEQIIQLISNAHINILPTFQATGIKLKLINALYKGRFCLVNCAMVENTQLESLCVVSDTPEDMILQIHNLWEQSWTKEMQNIRSEILDKYFSNQINIQKLIQLFSSDFLK